MSRRLPTWAMGAALAWCLTWLAFGLIRGTYIHAVIQGACALFWTYVLIERIRDGRHRQAEGDSDDSGSSADPWGSASFSITLDPGSIAWGSASPALPAAPAAEGPGLAERQQDEPITAWKQARLAFAGGRYYFRPLTSAGGSGYGVDATAACERDDMYFAWRSALARGADPLRVERHTAPAVECRCGFYALTEPPAENPDLCLLEVDLYGRVVVCEKGYRAEKQRVLSVTVPSRCYYCADTETHFVIQGEGKPLSIRCAAHTPADAIVVSREQVAAVLGTEVRQAVST